MKPDWIADDDTRRRIDPGLLCLFLLLIVAPLKFGAVLGSGGIPLFPLSAIEWIFGLWPPFLAAVLSGFSLLVVSICHRKELPERSINGWFPILPAVILLIGAIPGFIGTTEWAYAVPMAWHLASVATMAAAVHIQIQARPESTKWLLLAIVIGGCWCCWGTIEQVLWGFDRTRNAVEAMVKSGQHVPGPLLSRASQTRAFAYFTYPNNLAAHFLVVMPIMIAAAYRFGRKFEPVKVSSILLPALTLAISGWCFMQSGSLGGAVAVTGAIGGTLAFRLLTSGKKGSGKLFILLIVVSAIAATILVSKESGRLKSVGARFEYYRCAVEMVKDSPIKGVGWGEFYPWYMRLKLADAEETRLPHNLLLSFASQAGLLGALAASLFLLQPFWLAVVGKKTGWQVRQFWNLPIALSLFGWLAHSLADFNLMIPGTVLTVAALGPILLTKVTQAPKPKARQNPQTPIWVPAIAGIAVLTAIWMIPGEKAYQKQETALRAGNLPLARKHLKEATRLMPYSPHPDDMFARAMASRKSWNEAAKHWEIAVSRAPHRSGMHLRLASIYINAKKLEAAKESLATAEKWYPHSKNLETVRSQLIESTMPQPTP